MDDVNALIGQRFVTCLETLKETGRIKHYSDIYTPLRVERGNFAKQMNNPSRAILRPSWLSLLVEQYNVSPLWLLTGRGKILRK